MSKNKKRGEKMNIITFFKKQKKSTGTMVVVSILLTSIFSLIFYGLTLWKILSFLVVGLSCFVAGILMFKDDSTETTDAAETKTTTSKTTSNAKN